MNTGPAELIVIVVVLLVVVGPEQLPGVIRKAGQFVSQARSMTEGLRGEFMAGLDEIERTADPRRWEPDKADPLPIDHSDDPVVQSGAVPPVRPPDDLLDADDPPRADDRATGSAAGSVDEEPQR